MADPIFPPLLTTFCTRFRYIFYIHFFKSLPTSCYKFLLLGVEAQIFLYLICYASVIQYLYLVDVFVVVGVRVIPGIHEFIQYFPEKTTSKL